MGDFLSEKKRKRKENHYQPSTDSIMLPLLAQFAETAEYYSTAFHELTTAQDTRAA
ncbi:MAG: hypothetical protein IJB85_02375 [Clostridia bacterium]|nr:hypothetical protein [Clostridia bacterium]